MCEIVETLTVKQIQAILNIGSNVAYALIHSNQFPVKKIGHSYRIPAKPFYDWLSHSGSDATANGVNLQV